jgi:hypothetical protein
MNKVIKFRVIVDYRSGKRFNYCALTRDSRTDNGLFKLKNLKGSCLLNKPKDKQ